MIIFNGEIYNHERLRKKLEEKNYTFTTNSDTEVLLTYFIEMKENCVNKLRGMYSFLIWDEESQSLFGARDIFGIKPLYYFETEDFIAFSSEYKCLLLLLDNKTIDEEVLQQYLSFQFTNGESTMLKEIKKIPPGHYFTIKENKLTIKPYYDIDYKEREEVTKEDVYNVIKESLKKHMISDVEVGTFLSGGIDSSIIATLASKINPNIKSFSVGFGIDGYNELDIAKKTADELGIENIQIRVTEDEYIKALPEVKGKNYLLRSTTPLRARYIGNAKIFESDELKEVLKNYRENFIYQNATKSIYDEAQKRGYDYVTTMQYVDMNTWLPGDILLKGDRMSMGASIELRVPFLDKKVFELSSKLTLNQKVTKNQSKVLLREAFKDIIPKHVVEKKKLGFPTPIRVWLKGDLGKVVRKIWTIFMFSLWHQIFVEKLNIDFTNN